MSSILSIIQVYSALYSVDPRLVEAMIQVESGYAPNKIGANGEVGLMQILPITAHLSRNKLFDPETNIRVGVEYLSEMKRACVHKEDMTYIVCYNLGPFKAKKVKHPKQWPYYLKVKKEYDGVESKALQAR